MYTQNVTINNEVGLHARPATFFIQKANEFKSGIWLEKDDCIINICFRCNRQGNCF